MGNVHAQQINGKGIAHRLVADTWLTEEQYAHAKQKHEELGPVFK